MKRRLISAIMMAVGVLTAIVFGLIAIVTAESALRPVTEAQTPSEFATDLSTGKWELFELTGSIQRSGVGFLTYTAEEQNAPDLNPGQITILDPQGHARPLGRSYGGGTVQTYTRDQDVYTGVASFTAPVAGLYTFEVRSPGPDRVLISRPVLTVFTSPLGWAIPAFAGAIVFTVGLVLFLTDPTRRRRGPAPGYPPYPPHAGYPPYPPPPPPGWPGPPEPPGWPGPPGWSGPPEPPGWAGPPG